LVPVSFALFFFTCNNSTSPPPPVFFHEVSEEEEKFAASTMMPLHCFVRRRWASIAARTVFPSRLSLLIRDDAATIVAASSERAGRPVVVELGRDRYGKESRAERAPKRERGMPSGYSALHSLTLDLFPSDTKKSTSHQPRPPALPSSPAPSGSPTTPPSASSTCATTSAPRCPPRSRPPACWTRE
jgi:hypothetical protein